MAEPAPIRAVEPVPLDVADAERLAELEQRLFPGDGPWTSGQFAAEIRAAHTVYLGIREDGRVIGYAGLARLGPPEAPEFEVHTIGVDPERRGRGHGRLLLRTLLDLADAAGGPVFLDVRTDNTAAIGLYAAHGFARIGIRRRYYRPSGADAYVMRREAVPVRREGGDGNEKRTS